MPQVDLSGIRAILLVECETVFDQPVKLGRDAALVAVAGDVVAAAIGAAKNGVLELALSGPDHQKGAAPSAQPVIPILTGQDGLS